MATDTTFHGSCHCGRLRVDFRTRIEPEHFTPRACDCTFCRKHGAAYLSDPAGTLSIAAQPGALRRYRQGSENADFLICAHCGVLIAVAFEHDARIYAAVNLGCLDAVAGLGSPVPSSPQTLSPEQKMSRWLELWIPDVQVLTSGA
jgi:hypothetical protein